VIEAEALEPLYLNLDRLELDPRKSLTRFWRMSAGVPPLHPDKVASAVLWGSFALSSTTRKIQLRRPSPTDGSPARMSRTLGPRPKLPSSIRNTITRAVVVRSLPLALV